MQYAYSADRYDRVELVARGARNGCSVYVKCCAGCVILASLFCNLPVVQVCARFLCVQV